MADQKNHINSASDFDFDICNTCSANDCTGVIASAPESEEALEAYKEVYNFGVPEIDSDHN